jgi:ADP-ribose pyrophosphatase YjhB (NUDIX family)
LNPTRDFTVATFVVWQERVLLLWHRKLPLWLPPGGHLEPGELTDTEVHTWAQKALRALADRPSE